ncbi:hypothetical protein ABQE44_23735, partial [Mycolicibacterium sp. XJ2546]
AYDEFAAKIDASASAAGVSREAKSSAAQAPAEEWARALPPDEPSSPRPRCIVRSCPAYTSHPSQ